VGDVLLNMHLSLVLAISFALPTPVEHWRVEQTAAK
jgi:hypothetical protein